MLTIVAVSAILWIQDGIVGYDINVPYGLFAVAEKSWILGTYNVKGYVMLNLITGEVQEFKQEELPKFVTNN